VLTDAVADAVAVAVAVAVTVAVCVLVEDPVVACEGISVAVLLTEMEGVVVTSEVIIGVTGPVRVPEGDCDCDCVTPVLSVCEGVPMGVPRLLREGVCVMVLEDVLKPLPDCVGVMA